MFKNIFTEYLLKNRWIRVEPMTFASLDNKDLELFFDTSNQIEVYSKKIAIGSYYLHDLNQLIKILDTLPIDSV